MNIIEFFNPYNIDHIKAYKVLSETGFWPEGFVPDEIKFVTLWHPMVAQKMADAWVDDVIKKEENRKII